MCSGGLAASCSDPGRNLSFLALGAEVRDHGRGQSIHVLLCESADVGGGAHGQLIVLEECVIGVIVTILKTPEQPRRRLDFRGDGELLQLLSRNRVLSRTRRKTL